MAHIRENNVKSLFVTYLKDLVKLTCRLLTCKRKHGRTVFHSRSGFWFPVWPKSQYKVPLNLRNKAFQYTLRTRESVVVVLTKQIISE